MAQDTIFQLGEMLIKEQAAFHGQVLSFSNAIAAANQPVNGDPDAKVDKLHYRKLVRFLDDPYNDSFKFTISELRALDKYFTLQQQSLCTVPIFYRNRSLLDALAESSPVTFAVATRYLPAARTETVSRWDLRAMKLLLNRGSFENTDIDVEDIFHLGSNYDDIRKENWNHRFDERKASVVSFGSPFSCHATEKTLAEMFKVEPYGSPVIEHDQRLPIYFAWPGLDNRQKVKNSSFLIAHSNIPRLLNRDPATLKNFPRCDRGMLVGDHWFTSERIGQSHGLFVAQRKTDNCIYAAIIGAFGPDTYAVADCLAGGKINASLPAYDGKPGQPVFIAVVQTRTEERPKDIDRRETRSIVSSRVCHSELWQQDPAGHWHSKAVQNRTDGRVDPTLTSQPGL